MAFRVAWRATLLDSCSVRGSLYSVLGLFALAACTRPVAGRDGGDVVITSIEVSPAFVRAGAMVDVLFRVAGAAPSNIQGRFAGQSLECRPERRADGRFGCSLASVDPAIVPQGAAEVEVTVVDDAGAASVARTTATVDFDCPTIVSLSVSRSAARPGDEVSVLVDASEPLGLPPRISRAGRSWGVATLVTPTRYDLTYQVSTADPASETDLVVQLTDRAGNTTTDCGADGRRPVAIDHVPPTVDPSRFLLSRGAPGQSTLLTASTGAVRDDVRVVTINVYDGISGVLLTTLTPELDGSLTGASLGGQTLNRVVVEAVDILDRTSERRAISESWSLSLGSGTTPNGGLGAGVRLTPPSPDGRGLRDRTAEFAADVLAADGVFASIDARMGFELSGQLPNVYEDTIWIAGGYDAQNDAIVMFGGAKCLPPTPDDDCPLDYFDRTLILRWDSAAGEYEFTSGPVYTRGASPSPRGARKIAFNGQGCGVTFGGLGLREVGDEFLQEGLLSDAWQICHTPEGTYEWRPISPPAPLPFSRRGPIIYDPNFDRYVVVGGRSGAAAFPWEDIWFLTPGETPEDWRWSELLPRPSNFPGRDSHLLYYDPEIDTIAIGLGFVSPFSQSREWWYYQNSQLVQQGTAPVTLDERQGFGYAYDPARRQLTLWGDNNVSLPPDERVWLLTGTATNADGWRGLALDAPVPRAWPTVVYDAAREVVVAWGGQRFDDRFVPPDIYTLVTPPSYPYLLARVDLGAGRPKGIERLELRIVARGSGDADGTGPGQTAGIGARILLWDHAAQAWEQVAEGNTNDPLDVSIAAPDRFVSSAGVVPIAISSAHPGTESLDGRLEVDEITGQLRLQANVTLP